MLLGDANPDGTFRQQLIAALQDPEVVNILHQYSDYDTVPDGLHHQLGLRHDQSAYGDHSHDGKNSSTVPYTSLTGKPTVPAMTSYTPTFYDNAGAPPCLNGSAAGQAGDYAKIGNLITGIAIVVVGAGAYTAGSLWVDLPIAIGAAFQIVGTWWDTGLGTGGFVINQSVNSTKSQLVTTAFQSFGGTPTGTLSVNFNYFGNQA